MKYRTEYETLLRHAYLLRSSINLANDREQQIERTMDGIGFSSIPTERDNLTLLQVQTAKEIGGVHTRMLLDAPEEILKFHWGPLQIALSLLFAIIEKYKKRSGTNPMFQDDALDQYCREHHEFVAFLESLRDSILHPRHDNLNAQARFVTRFTGDDTLHMVALLTEGERIYKEYLKRLWHLLRSDSLDGY